MHAQSCSVLLIFCNLYNREDGWVYSYFSNSLQPIPKYELTASFIESNKPLYESSWFGEEYLILVYSLQRYIKQTYKLDCSFEDVHIYSGISIVWREYEKNKFKYMKLIRDILVKIAILFVIIFMFFLFFFNVIRFEPIF